MDIPIPPIELLIMHDIEPYYKWRELYIASEDERSPFYGRQYNEFQYTEKIYNYFIHPQWDDIGSQTLYMKILYVDYRQSYTIIELIGEWNDAVNNDIMYLKREIGDRMIRAGISKFILMCDNVLNFHGDDDCYYQEWREDVEDHDGWVCLVNLQDHVFTEMEQFGLNEHIDLGEELYDFEWRKYFPKDVYRVVKGTL